MKLPYASPDVSGPARARAAKEVREFAAELARIRPQALTQANGEEIDHGRSRDSCDPDSRDPVYPANFTKGLAHDEYGVILDPADYRAFVKGINGSERDYLDTETPTAESYADVSFGCTIPGGGCPGSEDYDTPQWRGWESPRAGHVYELEGPDPGSVAMAPAPRVGSSELAAEMAEVYALALLRDVPFTEIANGGNQKLCAGGGESELSAAEIVTLLGDMKFYSGDDPVSSTPNNTEGQDLNRFERNRRRARTDGLLRGALTTQNIFRGSAPGVAEGPYISQFMLVGNDSIAGVAGGVPSYPACNAQFDLEDGFIAYGSQIIDQRNIVHKSCLDYMTCWQSWLDVQNGAAIKNVDQFEEKRRFVTTPRDLATYVHFDALYQAYLNACLILLGSGAKTSRGFPEPSPAGTRTPFATFGGPHILSLSTEVATRCLKAVRRQKFNYHRRARPEALAGRLALANAGCGERLACAQDAFQATLNELPDELLAAVIAHNCAQNSPEVAIERRIECPPAAIHHKIDGHNILLPMAFPEGSPMHPAYGAGHATVAGGCVTMLKAFFDMYEDCNSGVLKKLPFSSFVPSANGTSLEPHSGPLTIQGELNKLAANIAIGRNMAGVHYYSDYYDSLRMGERVAVGILLEQAITYGDEVEMTFDSFDGDRLVIAGRGKTCPSLTVLTPDGSPTSARSWWLRHIVGEEIVEDF